VCVESECSAEFAVESDYGADFWEIVYLAHSFFQRLNVTVEILKSQFATEFATESDYRAHFWKIACLAHSFYQRLEMTVELTFEKLYASPIPFINVSLQYHT